MAFAPEMEPMLPAPARLAESELPDLAIELERKAAALAGETNSITAEVLESHMRVLNSYYSNLIEGNSTHPREIRKAMAGDYSKDPVKRDLQLESVAHIAVQQTLARDGIPADILAPSTFRRLHKLFYDNVPDSMRQLEFGNGEKKWVVPGAFRQTGDEVNVGRHLAPAPEDIERLLGRLKEAYDSNKVRGHLRVIAAMASHHRFAWIHPFLDGNGRVGRLHTDLYLRSVGVGACGVWCLSRGLARQNEAYKASLARGDFIRQGVSDGRGALSEKELMKFIEFMLHTAIDQIDYMKQLLDLQSMTRRIAAYVDDRNKGLVPGMSALRAEATRLIEKAFILGEFPRGQMDSISGLGHSVTRKLIKQLKDEGLLSETSSRSPLRWAIPEHAERYYFPDLSPT